jgi:hypothetical protein
VHRWTNRNNVGSGGISAESKFFQVRRMCKPGGEESVTVGSHSSFPKERGPSDLNEDKTSALKRRTELSR